MKSHFTAEQFFDRKFLTPLGILLALLRVAYAWTIAHVCLEIFFTMPEVLARVRVQTVPFIDALATAWSFSWWQGILLCAAFMFACGLYTRISAGVLLIFLVGVGVIDHTVLLTHLGAWSGVTFLILGIALFSRWGFVFGIDELLARLPLFRRKASRRGML